MYIKQIFILLLSLLFTSITNANAGFYVGTKIGEGFNVNKILMNMNNKSNDSARLDIGSTNFISELMLGYFKTTALNLYIAGEINLLYKSTSNTSLSLITKNSDQNIKYKISIITFMESYYI